MCNTSNITAIRIAFALELFGSVDRSQWSMENITLPKHPGIELKNSKLISLAKKYFSIPPQMLHYYPNIPENIQSMIEQDDNAPEGVPSQTREKKRARKAKVINDDKDPVGARKPYKIYPQFFKVDFFVYLE